MSAERGRAAVVTGASSGIGAAYARALGARGYDLVLVARRAERLERLAAEIGDSFGVDAAPLPADLACAADVERVVERMRRLPRLALLVNAAGFGTEGPFAESDVGRQVEMVHVHTVAVVRLTHAALASMLPRGEGAIVNVSSLGALAPLPGFATYAATKSAMLALSESLALELEGTGVHVQALCPGFTRTEFQEIEGADLSMVPKFLWLTPEQVVDASLRCLGRRVVCIPGLAYRLIALLAGPFGRTVQRFVARRRGWCSTPAPDR